MLRFIQSLFKKTKKFEPATVPAAPAYFDESYYVQQYPEVLAAGMQGWWHFYHHGYMEGRWPCALEAVQLETGLWGDRPEQTEQSLLKLLQSTNEAEKSSAAWFLGRWYAAQQRWLQVQAVMEFYIQCQKPVPGLLAPRLLWLEVLRRQDTGQANSYWEQLKNQYGPRVDLSLVRMNIANKPNALEWWQNLNAHYDRLGLMGIGVETESSGLLFDRLQGMPLQETPFSKTEQVNSLISVIVPAYNAEKTIVTAITSVVAQTWRHVEIIVVDDASTDDTAVLVQQLARQDSRIRLIQLPHNQGAYAARNMGLVHSQGQFITVHDSDDWSHPQKLEQQVLPLLQQTNLKGTLSHWVRASEDLFFGSWSSPEDWNGLVHRNVSSLLVRRGVVSELGFWDAVVCSADTEYYYRILTAYGSQSLIEVHAGLPLAFGRVRADSLTQRSETHIFSIFGGLRQRYRQAYENWHSRSQTPSDLYMSQYMDTRAFDVDAKMLRK
ncbi:glycosyltransferase family 2 protein [Paenalcaligenes hominis]|uniref:glycosyltransferase family 2 protein n=1 Tax=Paenalcaligenes hominis TaxID=643674 RepID=UPI00352551B2